MEEDPLELGKRREHAQHKPRSLKRRKGVAAPARTNASLLGRLLELGGRHDAIDREPGLRRLWRLAQPDSANKWLDGLPASPSLDEAAGVFVDAWWNYIKRLPGYSGALPPMASWALVELAARDMKEDAEMRGRFMALMFQVVVAPRHDQTCSSVVADPAGPQYSRYVSRTLPGALFSLRTLVELENKSQSVCNTVALFRKSSGKNPVVLARRSNKVEITPNTARRPHVYRCPACAPRKRAQHKCGGCSRMKEGDEHEIVRVGDVPRADALTTFRDPSSGAIKIIIKP